MDKLEYSFDFLQAHIFIVSYYSPSKVKDHTRNKIQHGDFSPWQGIKENQYMVMTIAQTPSIYRR